MTDGEGWPASALWDYAVGLYARPEVGAACLSLQDGRGADVALLLLACWLGASGRRPDPALLDRLKAEAATWQAEIVRPLRTARRNLKQRLPGLAPGLRAAAAASRGQLAEIELAAERIGLLMLEQAVGPAPAEARPDPAFTVAALERLGLIGDGGHAELLVLLSAAFPDFSPGAPAPPRERPAS